MTNSIRELTEKIYNEGVVKANKEAEQILSEARKEAENTITSAKNEKKRILDQADREAEEIKKKAHSEISLAGQKLISNLKQEVAQLLTSMQVDSLAAEAFNDNEFVKKMMLVVIESWAGNCQDNSGIGVLIPEGKENEISAYFQQKLAGKLNQGIEFKVDPSVRNGFKIGPKDGHFLISFTEQDFENYFKSYLKEKTWKLICGSS
jgi:V/A-type H+-transporting ATPase subunit E